MTRIPELAYAWLMVCASEPYSCCKQCYDFGVRNERLETKSRVCTCHTLQTVLFQKRIEFESQNKCIINEGAVQKSYTGKNACRLQNA